MSVKTLTSLVVLCLTASAAFAQVTNTTPWPPNPPVGIGTQLDGGSLNALHIHHDPLKATTWPAMLRLSEGDSTATSAFGLLGLMPAGTTTYSVLSTGRDLILHEHEGDLILTDAWQGKGTIRMSTTPYSSELPLPNPHVPLPNTDVERVTILPNGNVGIDLPPDTTTATPLMLPLDQVQIGGGAMAPAGTSSPVPGLTLYGGNRFEGMPTATGGTLPVDWRYLSFNHYQNHLDGSGGRFQPRASSGVYFGDDYDGHVTLTAVPWRTGESLSDLSGGMTLMANGDGLFYWCDERWSGGGNYHHLFDVFRPGQTPWPITRNTNGLFIHHTPVLITSDSTSTASIDFTHLANVHPDLGDGDTWDLAVNGPALFKEVFVNTNDWPDYVFLPEYKLRSIDEFGDYIKLNGHLPDISPASDMNGAHSLGKTQEQLTKQVEEMALYIVQLNKELTELKAEVASMKGGRQ